MLSGCHATAPTAPEMRRPRVLNYLLGTAFSAEALSQPARSACLLPICCRRTFWLALAVGKQVRARSFGIFFFFLLPALFWFLPFPFCCRRAPLVGARCGQTSAAWKSAGSKAFVTGRFLWTDSLIAYDSKMTLGTRPGKTGCRRMLWFVLAAAKRPPSALDAKLFLLVAPWDR